MKKNICGSPHNILEETADLVKFTEEMLNGKLHFLCSDKNKHG